MRIKLNLQIFIFALIFYISGQIKIYGILMASALLHELGHIFFGIVLGLKPKKLEIIPFGFSITFEKYTQTKNKYKQKLLIELAGPLVNLLIVLLCFFVDVPERENIIYANILLMLFNLIPIYPLDGGRILYEIIYILRDSKTALEIVNITSNIGIIVLTMLSSILILYYKNLAIICVILYLWFIVHKQNKIYKIKKRVFDMLENNKILID